MLKMDNELLKNKFIFWFLHQNYKFTSCRSWVPVTRGFNIRVFFSIKGVSYFINVNSLPGKFLGKNQIYCNRKRINIVYLVINILCTKYYSMAEPYSIHFFQTLVPFCPMSRILFYYSQWEEQLWILK